ncbi:AI-2E family transporter [Anabaena sp. CA = ATCC 33047]|uniref:AI-2E family transporter n=1 Tax=Anabaena sp. (strain CA / ATCC 33047) TaxID=52271 RepID=UPI000832878B|nr:AI-2E family transporter [Anabaena sp. CA = ATCC 33047]
MNISLEELLKLLIATLLFPLVFINGWLVLRFFEYFQPLVAIFILATLLAFILNYPVSLLQERGIERNYAIALVFFVALLVLIIVAIILVPVAIEQFHEIAKLLPQWIDASQARIQNYIDLVWGERFQVNVSQIITRLIDKIPDELEQISDKLLSIAIDTIDSLSEALVTIVLTFYFLLDGQRIWEGLFKKLPWSFAQKLSQSIQDNFQKYLIGQVSLAFLVGTSQTLMFLGFRVEFGLLFGLGIGIFSLIPFGDVVSLIVISLIIASHDFWLAVKILAVAVIIDQLIDQAIAPRLFGTLTGVRPVWVLISLLLGTYIGGLIGLIIAVPVAGLIKDIVDGWESAATPEQLTPESTSSP